MANGIKEGGENAEDEWKDREKKGKRKKNREEK